MTIASPALNGRKTRTDIAKALVVTTKATSDKSKNQKVQMKRLGKIYEQITSLANIQLADVKAQRGKASQYGVKLHNKNREANLLNLQKMLIEKTYRTSAYDIFSIYEPKERLVYRLPFYPDRIAHHAVMNVLEPIIVESFTADTYSCIKTRGIHQLLTKLKAALTDVTGTKYCLKLDIKKFYPSVDHDTLKALLNRKFKDPDLLGLLSEIIDSAPGLPIGNYLSQYLANFYLSYFDHWIKEQKQVRYYFRYADDIVILSDNKACLHNLLTDIKAYLKGLKLEVKPSHQVFPVDSRGIDFVGYVCFHTHTRIRKQIKKNFARKMHRNPNHTSVHSYVGWLSHCNAKHLTKKLLAQ